MQHPISEMSLLLNASHLYLLFFAKVYPYQVGYSTVVEFCASRLFLFSLCVSVQRFARLQENSGIHRLCAVFFQFFDQVFTTRARPSEECWDLGKARQKSKVFCHPSFLPLSSSPAGSNFSPLGKLVLG